MDFFYPIDTIEEGINYKTDIFDVTKTISKKDYPLVEVGKLVLNKNPSNYFSEVGQAAFSPGSLVPKIEPSPDKLLQSRLFSYGDEHRYRVGTNYSQLFVNAAINKVNNYQQDGNMNTKSVFKGINYEPNSLGGPVQNNIGKTTEYDISGKIGSFEYDTNYYSQVI
ncbi:hypothetical protein A5819_003646 [Enterococcus sp. 7E2_DIV0204]|nr:catalase [Enterococcus sp. 7E2_DIV0204]OTN83827.1 hypothetical protein A5819_003646 [Enterococcus sp. 7E2_DIV0204]OTP47527.1 hypothetical protein A5884_003498 [Enterococcus sp. 7D2_DIV0200]